jgi:hypothetical protein
VDPVPDPLLLRKSGSAGNEIRTSGSVARNSDHYTTKAVYFLLHNLTPMPESASELYPFFYITYINSVRTSQEAQYISVL